MTQHDWSSKLGERIPLKCVPIKAGSLFKEDLRWPLFNGNLGISIRSTQRPIWTYLATCMCISVVASHSKLQTLRISFLTSATMPNILLTNIRQQKGVLLKHPKINLVPSTTYQSHFSPYLTHLTFRYRELNPLLLIDRSFPQLARA